MRRLAFLTLVLSALALPSAALAMVAEAGDGSLVVRMGQAPGDTPVVQLDKFSGSIIGRVVGPGTIIIDGGPNCGDQAVQVVGAGRPSPKLDTAQQWMGDDFTFRAVGTKACVFTVIAYSANKFAGGGRVWLVAAGQGTARLAGMPDTSFRDGKYSLNDADFKSLPVSQTAKLAVGDG